MSYLAGVTSGPSDHGARIVIGGVEKSGKTELACDAPSSLLVPLEIGYEAIRTPRLPNIIDSFDTVIGICDELCQKAQRGLVARGSTIVWDSGTALEKLIHDYVIRLDPSYKVGNKTGLTMETAHGGYGKAYAVANQQFYRFLNYCDQLAIYGGINIIITCHVFPTLVKDPTAGEFHTWDLLLHSPKNDKTFGKREIITQWADLIGFLYQPIIVLKNDKGGMQQAIKEGNSRILGVERTPGYVAGNRYGLSGTIQIPEKGWNYLADPIYKRTGKDLYNRAHMP